jgi:hypothetical protein
MVSETIIVITPKDRRKAELTYTVEVVIGIGAVFFLAAWLHAMYEVKHDLGTGIFDPLYLKNGFCNAPEWPTQMWSSYFDFSMAALLAILIEGKEKWGVITYLLVHGNAHLQVHQGGMDVTENMSPKDIITLTIVLAMGSLTLYTSMARSKRYSKETTIGMSVFSLGFMVWLFVAHIQKGVYALTYINIAITLCSVISRLWFIGYTTDQDVQVRSSSVHDKYLYPQICSSFFLTFIMLSEPIACSWWFASIGGHFWFDVSLFLTMAVVLLNDRELKTQSVVTGKEKKL